MRKQFVILAVIFQVSVLLYMAGKRELLHLTGHSIFLRTAPLDPRDPFRGDFVHLQYEISRVADSYWRGTLAKQFSGGQYERRRIPVYAQLKQGASDVAELEALTDTQPKEGLFLRGYINQNYYSSSSKEVDVIYGLESYFVQQGKGRDIEAGRRRENIQVPMEMEIRVGNDGTGVIAHHRWCAMGIGINLENEPFPQPNNPRAVRLIGVKVELLNASDREIAIVDLPGARSFELKKARSNFSPEQSHHWVQETASRPQPTAEDVHLLKPNEKYSVHIDFRDPAWQVVKTGENPKSIGELPAWSESFRLIYSAPSTADCQGLPNADKIWHGHIASRAFSPNGGVD